MNYQASKPFLVADRCLLSVGGAFDVMMIDVARDSTRDSLTLVVSILFVVIRYLRVANCWF